MSLGLDAVQQCWLPFILAIVLEHLICLEIFLNLHKHENMSNNPASESDTKKSLISW